MDWSLLKKKLFLFYFYSNLTDVCTGTVQNRPRATPGEPMHIISCSYSLTSKLVVQSGQTCVWSQSSISIHAISSFLFTFDLTLLIESFLSSSTIAHCAALLVSIASKVKAVFMRAIEWPLTTLARLQENWYFSCCLHQRGHAIGLPGVCLCFCLFACLSVYLSDGNFM